jgi:6-phosphofructokinase 1
MNPLESGDRVAIITSGGDAPGMNAAIRGIVRVAHTRGLNIYGVRWGYQGLLNSDLAPLPVRSVDGISRRGGTVLGTSRCPEFLTAEGREKGVAVLHEHKIKGIIVIGGNGSLAGAHALAEYNDHSGVPFRVMGIPASIDNDIGCTSMCIGTDTAMNTILEACDRIADTACAHARTFIIEVMGRDCGYLAMTTAIAAESDGVLMREENLSPEQVLDRLVHIVQQAYDPDGRQQVVVIKSEGVKTPVDYLKTQLDKRLAESDLPVQVETRVTVLGHVCRGGVPTASDRLMSQRMGHAALRAMEYGRSDEMTAWHVLRRPGDPEPVVFELDPYITFWPLEQVLEETARIANGSSEVTKWRVKIMREVEPMLAQ